MHCEDSSGFRCRKAQCVAHQSMIVERCKYIIWAVDMNRAVQFYTRAFGGVVLKKNDIIAEVSVCGAVIGIHGGGDGKGTWTGLSFQVPDVIAGASEVVAAGGRLLKEPEPEDGEPPHLAMCADTDGNEFMLSRKRHGASSQVAAPPSPQLFFETVNSFQRSAALKAAIELDLFTAFGRDSATATELATRCGCPERGIRILCDNLTILGFLSKEENRYAATLSTLTFLDKTSPAYFGDAVKFLLAPALTEAYADLAATVRRGRLHTSEHGTTEADHPAWVDFARAMRPLVGPAAEAVASLVALDASRNTRVLDISASHGAFGIAFAQKHPRAHLVALDWESVLAVTKENAEAAGVADRFSSIVGDAFTVELGADYDVVLVPNFLHHFNVADCTRFLRRAHAALRPGGSIVIVEFVPNDDRITPAPAAAFSLVMLGTTPEGDAYTFAEYGRMLADAGFQKAELHPLPPTAESAVIAKA